MEKSALPGNETVTITVSVAVPRPVWQTYTYSLPESMQGGRLKGCRVVVPLGSSRIAGIIMGDAQTPPSGIKLKDVLERLDSTPLLPPAVLELVEWASEYYMAPPGMTAAAAFPPGMQGKAVRMVKVTERSSLYGICGEKPLEYRLLSNMAPEGIQIDRILAEEASAGTSLSWWEPESLPPAKTISMIEPLAEPDSLTRTAQTLKSTAGKQAEILACLAVMGRTPKKELLKAAGAGKGSLDRLREMGLLKEVPVRVSRDPLQRQISAEGAEQPELNTHQTRAVHKIAQSGKGTFLLYGITGSGKTEVYLNLIQKVLEAGKGAIVLVPEISLTPLAVSRFSMRFPGMAAVLHSGLSRGERLDTWNMVQRGEKRIVIGPRSAVFAPVHELGIIVVDEEHDGSYKQGSIPRYNGRDLSVMRGLIEKVPVVLGSASPSAESWKNAIEGRYTLLRLPERATGRELPKITLVDSFTHKHSLLSDELLAAIGKRTAKGEQSIVLINRRGHSPVQMCFACGFVERCPSCGISLTYHKQGEILRCHHCGKWKSAAMRCPVCSGEEFTRQGPGIQKVEQVLKELLPSTRIIRMDADTTRGKSAHWKIIDRFSRGEGDVLLGTQMVAKGHDFPEVTLAAVIGAEMGLYLPDFRAAETTFSLLLQVSGRSGRSRKPGEVIIQTMDVENPVIRLACSHDYETFIKDELSERQAMGFPPYARMARLLWSGENLKSVRRAAEEVMKVKTTRACRLMGPSEAAMARIADKYRYSALLTADSHRILAKAVESYRRAFTELGAKSVRLEIDIDPRNMM